MGISLTREITCTPFLSTNEKNTNGYSFEIVRDSLLVRTMTEGCPPGLRVTNLNQPLNQFYSQIRCLYLIP